MKCIIKILVFILIIILIQSCKKEADNTIRDIDGNVYTSVTIGTQVWMVENLKTTKYSNGDLIGTTIPATLDISAQATPKYQWAYDGDEINAATYGRLYTGYAVTDTRNVCPIGWHVPTVAEWTILINYLGGVSIAGSKLKESGNVHWTSPNTDATNESGFTALPGGNKYWSGGFNNILFEGSWWSSTLYNARYLNAGDNQIGGANEGDYSGPSSGCSVRCLKDG